MRLTACRPEQVRCAQGKLRELDISPCLPDRSKLASGVEGSQAAECRQVRSLDSVRKLTPLGMTEGWSQAHSTRDDRRLQVLLFGMTEGWSQAHSTRDDRR